MIDLTQRDCHEMNDHNIEIEPAVIVESSFQWSFKNCLLTPRAISTVE